MIDLIGKMRHPIFVSDWLLRVSRYFLIGTLFVSLGGHLVVLQTIAWGTMLKSFSRSSSLEEAAKKTFDGDHPCALCKVVEKSKQQEEKKSLLKAVTKMDVALPIPILLKLPSGVPVVIVVPGYFGIDAEVCLAVFRHPPRSV